MSKTKLSEIRAYLKENPNSEFRLLGTRKIYNTNGWREGMLPSDLATMGEDLTFTFKGMDLRLFEGDNYFSAVKWAKNSAQARIVVEAFEFLEENIEFDSPEEEA